MEHLKQTKPKINSENLAIFQHRKGDCQNTTSATQSATPTPQKHHTKTAFSPKPPARTRPHYKTKIISAE